MTDKFTPLDKKVIDAFLRAPRDKDWPKTPMQKRMQDSEPPKTKPKK